MKALINGLADGIALGCCLLLWVPLTHEQSLRVAAQGIIAALLSFATRPQS